MMSASILSCILVYMSGEVFLFIHFIQTMYEPLSPFCLYHFSESRKTLMTFRLLLKAFAPQTNNINIIILVPHKIFLL